MKHLKPKRDKIIPLLSFLFLISFLIYYGFAGEIHRLAKIGDEEQMKSLLEQNPELLNNKDAYGWTPICEAVFGKRKAMADFIISRGACVNVRTRAGSTPLEIAVNFNYTEIARALKKEVYID